MCRKRSNTNCAGLVSLPGISGRWYSGKDEEAATSGFQAKPPMLSCASHCEPPSPATPTRPARSSVMSATTNLRTALRNQLQITTTTHLPPTGLKCHVSGFQPDEVGKDKRKIKGITSPATAVEVGNAKKEKRQEAYHKQLQN